MCTDTVLKNGCENSIKRDGPEVERGTPTSRHLQGAGEPITYKCAAPLIYRMGKDLSVRVV